MSSSRFVSALNFSVLRYFQWVKEAAGAVAHRVCDPASIPGRVCQVRSERKPPRPLHEPRGVTASSWQFTAKTKTSQQGAFTPRGSFRCRAGARGKETQPSSPCPPHRHTRGARLTKHLTADCPPLRRLAPPANPTVVPGLVRISLPLAGFALWHQRLSGTLFLAEAGLHSPVAASARPPTTEPACSGGCRPRILHAQIH